MLCVKTKIGKSSIHGIGLFADQFIEKGTVVQKLKTGFDLTFDQKDLESLSSYAREQVFWYGYKSFESKNYVLPGDDDRFLNHSDSPNLEVFGSDVDGGEIAIHDIRRGEELTVNYKTFDSDWKRKLG